GIRYLLAGANQNRIQLSAQNVLPGIYFLLSCPPQFSAVFPWVRLTFRYPFDSVNYPFPPGYFIEPTAGALCLAPFVASLVFSERNLPPAVRILLRAMFASSLAILLFLAATGFTTQRYEVDFLPLAVLASMVSLGIQLCRATGLSHLALGSALAITIAASAVVNLALGISGPYDEMLKNRPARYLRIA